MPDAFKIKLDSAGMLAVLQSSEVRAEINAAAEDIGNFVRGNASVQARAADVVVDHYTTDRAAASVTIKHPGGRGIEAKYGPLTRGAGAVGLEVRAR